MPQSAVVLKCLNVYGGPTREEAEMFCPKCGAANLDEHKFCASCGNPLQTVGAVTEQKHSGVGIASSIMGIAAIVLTVLLIIVAGAMDASTTDGLDNNAVVVVGGCGVALMALGIVALSLGIVGLFQKDRRKMFPILGTVPSSVMLFGMGRFANHGILLRGESGVRCRGAPLVIIWGFRGRGESRESPSTSFTKVGHRRGRWLVHSMALYAIQTLSLGLTVQDRDRSLIDMTSIQTRRTMTSIR